MGSGAKTAPSNKRKRPSAAQKAARAGNLRAFKDNKENIPPSVPPPLPAKKHAVLLKNYKHEYQKLQSRFWKSKSRQKKLEADVAAFKLGDTATKRRANVASQRITDLSAIVEKFVLEGRKKSEASGATIETLRKQVKALKQRMRHSIRGLSCTVERAKKKWSFRRVTEKGIYTIEARKLARLMADSGCARRKVGPLMEWIGEVFGVQLNRSMSRRTVGRAIEEGGVAAKIQVIYELLKTPGTYSMLAKGENDANTS
jgi:hypothetical protein